MKPPVFTFALQRQLGSSKPVYVPLVKALGAGMVTAARLQAYFCEASRAGKDVVSLPPFTIYLNPTDPASDANLALPDESPGGDLRALLAQLHAVFRARGSIPRITFLDAFAPALVSAVEQAGFVEEYRSPVLVCTPATLRPPEHIPGLCFVTLSQDSSLDEIREGLDANELGFDPTTSKRATEAEAEEFRRGLDTSRAFIARLHGETAGGGMYNPPYGGLTELIGIATLERFRRRGIGGALTAHMTELAFAAGVEAVVVRAADEHAGRVYRRVGFAPSGTMLGYRAPDA